MTPAAIVQKLWNYCNVLRDDGMSYGDYVEQLTFLLFLKMADERGQTADAESGTLRNLNAGETWDGAIFAENRFKFGRLSIVPGMRLEFLNQTADEQLNVSKISSGEPLASQSDFNFVPLFGLGLGYVLVEGEPILSPAPVAGGKGAESKNPPGPVVAGFGPPRRVQPR